CFADRRAASSGPHNLAAADSLSGKCRTGAPVPPPRSRMVPATASVADSCCAIDSAPVEAVQPVPESGLDGESSCSPLSATASPYQCRSLGVTHCCRKLTMLSWFCRAPDPLYCVLVATK